MAMTNCRECKQGVSTVATACPHCGAPAIKQSKPPGPVAWIVGGLVLVGVYQCTSSISTPPVEKTQAQKLADAKKEKDFQTVVAGAKWIKQSLKNPKSFELVSAGMVDGGKALCYTYRGTNSFNAVVTQHRVITDHANSGEAKDWNKHCAGQPQTDFTYARQAL